MLSQRERDQHLVLESDQHQDTNTPHMSSQLMTRLHGFSRCVNSISTRSRLSIHAPSRERGVSRRRVGHEFFHFNQTG